MVFQLSDLAKMFSCLLEQLRGHPPGHLNSTRFTDRLLAQIPELGKFLPELLEFFGDNCAALHFTQSRNYDTAAMHLAKATMLVRKELLYYIKKGVFDTDCQRPAVPHLFLALEQLIFRGTKRHEQK